MSKATKASPATKSSKVAQAKKPSRKPASVIPAPAPVDASLPVLLNDGSAHTVSEVKKALAHAKTLKCIHTQESVRVPEKAQSIARAKQQSNIVTLRPHMNVAQELALSGAALAHWQAISRNRLHAKFGNPESRNAAVRRLVESGKIKSVPQTLSEYVEMVIAPLCASGHISNNCASDPCRVVSGASQTRPYLNTTPHDALAVLIGVCSGLTESTAKKASADLLNTRFYPSVKFISECLAAQKVQA